MATPVKRSEQEILNRCFSTTKAALVCGKGNTGPAATVDRMPQEIWNLIFNSSLNHLRLE